MTLLKQTSWKLETSEETSTSVWVITGGEGKLYFEHESTGQKFTVKYTYGGPGIAKGAVFNIAQSVTSDPSGGFSNVKVKDGYDFGPGSFPCWGYMVVCGATAGIFQPSFMSHSGADIGIAVFGSIPFGGIPFYGRFNSILPSAGPSVAICTYEI